MASLYEIEYTDTLLLAILRRFKPEYRERMGVEHPGSVDVVERLQAARARLIQLEKPGARLKIAEFCTVLPMDI